MKFGTHDIPESTDGLIPDMAMITRRWRGQSDKLVVSIIQGAVTMDSAYEVMVWPADRDRYALPEEYDEPFRFDSIDDIGKWIDVAQALLKERAS